MTNSNDPKPTTFTKWLAVIALTSLCLTLLSIFIAIWLEKTQKEDLFKLTNLLLNWKIIAGGLVIGGSNEIKKIINKFC